MILAKLYTKCSTLPLGRFMEILVSGNLKRLIVFGYVSPKTLKRTWNGLFSEYISMTKDATHSHMLNTVREYEVLIQKIQIVQVLINSLNMSRHQGLIDTLKKMGFNKKFTKESLDKDLLSVIAKVKTWVMRANNLKKEIDEKTKDNKDPLSLDDFHAILAELSAFQGYRINPQDITVTEYVSVLNRYKKFVEDGESRKNNRNSRR